jgi:hypothetical protein
MVVTVEPGIYIDGRSSESRHRRVGDPRGG